MLWLQEKFSLALCKASFNLVLKYLNKQSYRDSTSSEKLSSLKQYTYYHLNLSCIRAVPEIILGGYGPQALFCPVGGGCFVDNVSEGWGANLSWGSRHI